MTLIDKPLDPPLTAPQLAVSVTFLKWAALAMILAGIGAAAIKWGEERADVPQSEPVTTIEDWHGNSASIRPVR